MKITEAMNQMKTNGVLQDYATSADFVNAFGGYMKLIRTCDVANMANCFVPTFTTGTNKEITTASDLKTGVDFGKTTYTSPLIGVQFINGVQGIIAYNPQCPYVDPYDNQAVATDCLSMVYDLNGASKPNKIGKDIHTHLATITGCDGTKIGSLCVDSEDNWATTYGYLNTYSGSAADKDYDLACNINISQCTTNYWARAKQYCKEEKGGMRLPTKDELNTMYIHQATIDGFSADRYWASEESSSVKAWNQDFATGSQYDNGKYNQFRVRCVR